MIASHSIEVMNSGVKLAKVARIQVEQLQHRLDVRRITLDVNDDAMSWLVNRGFDPIYGARPLRRLMQREIDDRLARALLTGEIRDGDHVVVALDAA